MKQIDRRTAKKLFEQGKEIILAPHKMSPLYGLHCSKENNHGYEDFDKLDRAFTWFECNEYCGKYPRYYTAQEN